MIHSRSSCLHWLYLCNFILWAIKNQGQNLGNKDPNILSENNFVLIGVQVSYQFCLLVIKMNINTSQITKTESKVRLTKKFLSSANNFKHKKRPC